MKIKQLIRGKLVDVMLSFSKVVETYQDGQFYNALYTEFNGYPIFFEKEFPALIVADMPANFDFSKPGMIVSAKFLMLSSATQEFLLYHEIGQFENKNMEMPYKERERLADKYAAQKVSIEKAIDGLEGLKEYANRDHDKALELNKGNEFGRQHADLVLTQMYQLIDKRIKNLKETVMV